MAQVFLGLGSNLGDRVSYLDRAVAALAAIGPVRRSAWYETEPVGIGDAPSFINIAVALATGLAPAGVLARTRTIEERLGRDPRNRVGSRTIDIDILLWGSQIVRRPAFEVPHPRLHLRAFVLVPLAELAPEVRHPILGCTLESLRRRVDVSGVKSFSMS